MGLRVGVIGAGLMGTTHVRALGTSVRGAEVVAVCDAVAASAERLAAEAGAARATSDASGLIADPGVDAVVVASPGDTHEAYVLACLEAGKPVLCEKPLATSAAATRRVLEAEAAVGRRLIQVGFMRRFDPGYADMKARIDGGDIGAPVLAYSIHRNPSAPPSFGSEMIVKDTVVHDIDTLRWLLGQELVRATVFTPRPSGRAPAGVDDPLVILFETDAGALVQVEAFVNAQYGYDIRCEVVGEDGTVTLAPPATVRVRRAAREMAEVPMRFQERFAAAYVHELQAWVAGIAAGRAAGASAWDGHAAAAVCDAAVEALRTRRPVGVRLGERPHLHDDARG